MAGSIQLGIAEAGMAITVVVVAEVTTGFRILIGIAGLGAGESGSRRIGAGGDAGIVQGIAVAVSITIAWAGTTG